MLFLLSRLCTVWHKNFLHWHATFAKCSEHLFSTVIGACESVGNCYLSTAYKHEEPWGEIICHLPWRIVNMSLIFLSYQNERSQTALVAGVNCISFVNVATVFIKKTNIKGRSNTKNFTKVLSIQGRQ